MAPRPLTRSRRRLRTLGWHLLSLPSRAGGGAVTATPNATARTRGGVAASLDYDVVVVVGAVINGCTAGRKMEALSVLLLKRQKGPGGVYGRLKC